MTGQHHTTKRMSIRALLAIIAIIVVFFLVLLPAWRDAMEAMKQADCVVNLKQFGLIYRMYAGENGGAFPRRTPYDTPVSYMVSAEDLYPDYWTDPYLLFCPADRRNVDARGRAWLPKTEVSNALFDEARHRDAWKDITPGDLKCLRYAMSMSRSYVYIGHVVWDWQAVRALEDARRSAIAHGLVEKVAYDFSGTPCVAVRGDITGAPGFWDIDTLVPGGNVPAFGDFQRNVLRGSTPDDEPQLLRIREGVEHYFEGGGDGPTARRKAQERIPVLWEGVATPPDGARSLIFNHGNPKGGNVLYMDGHCEYVRYEDRQFPYGPKGLGAAYDLTPENLDLFLFGQG